MNMDPILYWNAVTLEVHRRDFTPGKTGNPKAGGEFSPLQGGPTRTSRAFAMVHVAMYAAVAMQPGSSLQQYPGVAVPPNPLGNEKAAVAGAAICVLTALYDDTTLRQYITEQAAAYMAAISLAHEVNGVATPAVTPAGSRDGIRAGDNLGRQVLALRENDGSANPGWYVPGVGAGMHREDPYQPGQGYLGARWGSVKPFAIASNDHTLYIAPPPQMVVGGQYEADFNEVKAKGVGRTMNTSTSLTSATRTAEETTIGIFWGYDGANGLGTPPRLYNQCVRAIVAQHAAALGRNTTEDHARLFALVNVAMADSGIIAWGAKYHYNLWRPVVGVRENNAGYGPSAAGSGIAGLQGDPCWGPLGAPQTNLPGKFNATPSFPAYPSGHATFGASAFRTVELFYGQDLSFEFVSDEFDGKNMDPDGSVRTLHRRNLTLSQAIRENSLSRVYLGVHWKFDGVQDLPLGNRVGGVPVGIRIADDIFASTLRRESASARGKAAAKGTK